MVLATGNWWGSTEEATIVGRIHDRDLWKHQTAQRELDAAVEADPRDVSALIWRANPRRLDAEAIRDAMLSVSDEIEGRTPPPVLPVVPGHEVVGRVDALGS